MEFLTANWKKLLTVVGGLAIIAGVTAYCGDMDFLTDIKGSLEGELVEMTGDFTGE